MPTARAECNVNESATAVLLDPVAGKAIRVHAAVLQAAGDVSISLQGIVPGTSTTTYIGPMHQTAGTGFPLLPISGDYWFQTVAGANLTMVLSDAVQVGGIIRYTYVDVG